VLVWPPFHRIDVLGLKPAVRGGPPSSGLRVRPGPDRSIVDRVGSFPGLRSHESWSFVLFELPGLAGQHHASARSFLASLPFALQGGPISTHSNFISTYLKASVTSFHTTGGSGTTVTLSGAAQGAPTDALAISRSQSPECKGRKDG
jgi:hypothetical protein